MKLRRIALGRLLVFVIFVQGVSFASAQVPVQAWVQRYAAGTNGTTGTTGGRAIGLDTNGNVFVSGSSLNGSNFGFATLAYSSTGTPLWTNRYDAGSLGAEPYALAVGRDGNVFVTGSSYMPASPAAHATGYQFATVAYSSSGAALWTNSFSEGGDARAVAIAVGRSGTVFVTGTSSSIMTTLAYSSAGVPLWTNHYQRASGQPSSASSIALDDKENVFVAGYARGIDGYEHYAVVAYSSAGVLLWAEQYIGPANFGEAASAVAVGGSGHVFVTGTVYDTNGFAGYVTVAYSGAGIPLWTNRYASDNASQASAIAIAVDTNGTVFVTGQSWSGSGFPDYATVAYNAVGSAIWTNRYDGVVHRDDYAVAAAVDGRGHVMVTGFSGTDTVNHDYATIWYSTSGAPLFTNRYNGPANGNDQASALAVDTGGNVFVTGTSWNGTIYEFATIKYAVLQPVPLLVQRLGDQIVLNWTNAAFGLQAAPTVSDVFTNVPGATSPYTNRISAGRQFFRLISM